MKKGFTLIEFVIVIGILGLSIGSIMLILTTVVKGVNQSNIQAEVKQNGQSILDTLSSQIRNAQDVYELPSDVFGINQALPAGATSGIWIWLSSGEKLTLICVDSTASANGYIAIYTGPSTEVDTSDTITSSFKKISNTNTETGVDIDCNADTFAVSPTAKIVFIDFLVNQGVLAPSRVDYKANAQFKTSIALRQYQ